jgi:hypothetical protein
MRLIRIISHAWAVQELSSAYAGNILLGSGYHPISK